MAILNNTSEDVMIYLQLNKKNGTTKWIGYELKILSKKGEITEEFLSLINSNELYFENFVEPEIPALCNALDQIAKGEIQEFLFEPIDERDFRLELKHENGIISANIFLEEAQVLSNYQWNFYSMIGVRMKINKEDIETFSNQLKEEFKLISE